MGWQAFHSNRINADPTKIANVKQAGKLTKTNTEGARSLLIACQLMHNLHLTTKSKSHTRNLLQLLDNS